MGRKDQIRLVIADDHRLFREGLVELLRREEGIRGGGGGAHGRGGPKALREGARGYLQKNVSSGELLKAIRAVHAGEAWIERGVMGHLLEELPRQENRVNKKSQSAQLLSQREAEVARFVAEGLSNKEVADRLLISEKTVQSHLVSIFRKLHLRHRLQLALYTLERDSILNRRPNDG